MRTITKEIRLYPVNRVEAKEIYSQNIIQIGAQQKWEKGITGKEVIVSVIDTGVDDSHPSLRGQVISGFNFTEDYQGDISIYTDNNGHGTHIAGIIAGKFQSENKILGIAPDSKILALKVLDSGGNGNVEELIEAIYFSIDWRGLEKERVNIINLSLGVKHDNPILLKAIKDAVTAQISVVAAAGNYGDGNNFSEEYLYPGVYQEVIEVGAMNETNEVAFFSNTNEEIDLYAPGVSIKSAYLNNEIVTLSGTSMAVPHVSGAIALLKEQETKTGQKWSEREIFLLLCKNAKSMKLDNPKIAGCGSLYLGENQPT